MIERAIPELLSTGIVIIDKPPRVSSHEVSAWVRRILHLKRAGHSGTLDPNVTGVLPVALERATSVLPYLTKKEKIYVGIIRFKEKQTVESAQNIFDSFTGEITQLPPRKSAVRRVPRKRTVHYFRAVELGENERDVLFEVKCEAGTYIRALARDIALNFTPARLIELRRTAVGHITENMVCTMQDLIDAYWFYENKGDESRLRKLVRPIEEVIDLPRIVVVENAVAALCSGSPLYAPGIKGVAGTFEKDQHVAIVTENGDLIEIAAALVDSGAMREAKRGAVAKPVRVIMPLANRR